jgi:hypothetical protein
MNFELKTFIAMVKFSMYGPLHLSGWQGKQASHQQIYIEEYPSALNLKDHYALCENNFTLNIRL